MRAKLIATLLCSVILAACSTKGTIPPSKHISQSGPLKVHPGLLGEAVPAELQEPAAEAKPIAKEAPAEAAAPIAKDAGGLPDERSIYFDYRSADIKPEAEPVLKAHARYLAANPQARVRVEGNADERGTAERNKQLGAQRADNIRSALIAGGAGDKQIGVKSNGEAKPKASGHNEESWAENRRADIIYERQN